MDTVFRTQSEQEHWERCCCGKQRYPSRAAAEAHRDLLHRTKIRHDGKHDDFDTLSAYACPFSYLDNQEPIQDHFHLGHG